MKAVTARAPYRHPIGADMRLFFAAAILAPSLGFSGFLWVSPKSLGDFKYPNSTEFLHNLKPAIIILWGLWCSLALIRLPNHL